ncbi:MAG: response regulator transcription factor [Clostridia bacterium]|nr:response regulator transcription factor [Clostridia bacterium]
MFKIIKIAICDDEKSYLQILEFKLNKALDDFASDFEIVSFDNLNELSCHLEENLCDILFLDIKIGNTNSVEWSVENLKNRNTQIIFMTAFPEEAYALSESRFCYYIIKPRLTDEMLSSAVSKALLNISKKDVNLATISIGRNNYTINFQELLYIEAINNNLNLHFLDDNMIIYSTMKEFLKNLPINFLKVHKSYIVNMNHITAFKPHKFTVSDGTEIPIPLKKYSQITKIYKNYISKL